MSANLCFLDASGNFMHLPEHLSLNMTGSNTSAFLAALGFDPDFENNWEKWPVADFAAAIRRFRTSEIGQYVDEGRPATEDRRPGGALFVDCGRASGYLARRAQMAEGILAGAAALGAVKCYFA